MTGKKLAVLGALVATSLVPAAAHATTVTVGNPNLPAAKASFMCFTPTAPCGAGTTFAQAFISPSAPYFPPAAGVITNWRVVGNGTLKLRVLESGGEEGWIGRGTSAAATHLKGEANPTNIPIGYGDLIGVDFPSEPASGTIDVEENPGAQILNWHPALPDNGPELEAKTEAGVLALNAEVVLTPVVASLSPASGSITGGNAVKITGSYLDSAASVTFGSTPASSFSVDSPSQITAIAPASAASTVDVRVSGPGGSSAVSPADQYTSVAPPATSPTSPLIPVLNGQMPAKPTVTGFSQSASRWRRGRSLPHISSAGGAPLGTTFSFSVNEPAIASIAFTERVPGRRVKGRCEAMSTGNVGKPRCKRTSSLGSFNLAAHQGTDKVKFQGRLSSGRSLKPGSYAAAISARNSLGLRSLPQTLGFTIVS